MTALDDVRRALTTRDELHRTILCPPDLQQPIQHLVDTEGLGGFFTVTASFWTPPDKVLIVRHPKRVAP